MFMIQKLCEDIAKALKLSEEQLEVIIFGMESAISTIFSFGLTLLFSWFLGVWKLTLLVMAAFAAIKVSAGGAHCKTMLNCALFTSFTFTLLAKSIVVFQDLFIAYQFEFLILTILITLTTHYFWSPAQTPEKPISDEYCKKLRRISFATLFLLFSLLYVLLAFKTDYAYPIVIAFCLGILCHSITITPFGYLLLDRVDYALSWALKRRC